MNPEDPGSVSASLTEEEKMAARVKRFATPSTGNAKPAKARAFGSFAVVLAAEGAKTRTCDPQRFSRADACNVLSGCPGVSMLRGIVSTRY